MTMTDTSAIAWAGAALHAAIAAGKPHQAVVDTMQTRAALYESIGYHAYEQTLHALFNQKK